MLKSMTAYGRAVCQSPKGRFVVEMSSVNRKFLEVKVSLPSELLRFETEVKKWVGQRVKRGLVIVRVGVQYDQDTPTVLKPNVALAKEARAAWDKIADSVGLPTDSFKLSLIKDIPGLLEQAEEFDDDDSYRAALKEAVEQSLDGLLQMKTREGEELKGEFLAQLERVQASVDGVRSQSGQAVDKMREKLKQRLDELLESSVENEERLLREIAVYAERLDISEEIARLDSHLKQFASEMTDGEPSGKRLDFLTQEMTREVNTIGAKASDLSISQAVVDMKTEIERIREQLQNVE